MKTACWISRRLNLLHVYAEITCNGLTFNLHTNYSKIVADQTLSLYKSSYFTRCTNSYVYHVSSTLRKNLTSYRNCNLVLMLHWISFKKTGGEWTYTITGTRYWLMTRPTLNSLYPQRKIGRHQLDTKRVEVQRCSGMSREETTDFLFPVTEY